MEATFFEAASVFFEDWKEKYRSLEWMLVQNGTAYSEVFSQKQMDLTLASPAVCPARIYDEA